MDELKLRLSTKFMRGIVAKLVSKAIFKKLGCSVDIQFNAIEVKTEDGKIKIHANVDAGVNNDDFVKIIKTIGIES